MDRNLSYQISSDRAGYSIEAFLTQRGYSSRLLSHLRSYPSGIRLNGAQAYTTRVLSEHDCLEIHISEFSPSEKLIPSDLPFSVIYEDEDLAVINKPAGMPVHPSLGSYTNTLANACAWYYRSETTPFIFRAVNRLDRDTTGLMILAKNPLSAAILQPMAAQRRIRRTYLAAAEGQVSPAGTVNAPIARTDDSTIERCVDFVRGERAVTHYERLLFENNRSLVMLKPETGRTHQIRVHMKYLGHPLPGDFLYAPGSSGIDRQALHSWKLDFVHPITGMPLSFTAPLPEDIRRLFPSFSDARLPV